MNEAILAGRYAHALVDLAEERQTLDRVDTELSLLADILMPDRGSISVPELVRLLGQPRVALADKIRITDLMLEKLEFTEEVGNLLNVLISRQRVGLTGLIAERFHALAARRKGVVNARAAVARPLQEKDRRTLKSALEAALGREVDLDVHEDPSLIGGLRVRVDSTLIDGSVAGGLDRLATELTT
jgi:F-type H+-transporting ATPase subunit delta